MSTLMVEKLVRFQRPETSLGYTRMIDDTTRAALFGTTLAEYHAAVSGLDRQRDEAARLLALDPDIRSLLQRVPFLPGQQIVAIGDSTTSDRLSWFEILRTLFTAERDDLHLSFENHAVAGATTTQILAATPGIRRAGGDWIFCMLGTNDAQRFDPPNGTRLVSQSETTRNLQQIREQTQGRTASHWVWVTPTAVDESRVAEFIHFRNAGISWANSDITAISNWIQQTTDPVIGSAPALASAGDLAYTDDGVHPSITTQAALAARTLEVLAKEPTQ